MSRDLNTISKFLSYVLRHKPDAIDLKLDPHGWANINELISKADIPLTPNDLREVVATSDKKRFAISPDGLFIRANQGHSSAVNLGLEPTKPPEFLYHGTARKFLGSIKKQGLLPQSRQFVHLSADTGTAIGVGQRHGKPVVLKIHALQMHQKGHLFFKAQNGVWLTEKVEPQAIQESSTDSATT